MSSKNYEVISIQESASYCDFILNSSSSYQEAEEPLPTIVDYDEDGEIFRIELVYLQEGMERLKEKISGPALTRSASVALQVGETTPVSLLLWLGKLDKKSQRHQDTKSSILISKNQGFVGVRVYHLV